jgi:hypothetical protein
MQFDLDIPAWAAYAGIIVISLYSAAKQVEEQLNKIPLRWTYLSSYLLFIVYFGLPIGLFWALDRVGAIHDSSLISALIVAFTYRAIVRGQSDTKSSAVAALFKPILDWVNEVPGILAERIQAEDDEFATAVANNVAQNPTLLGHLEDWVVAHATNIVSVRRRLLEFDNANPMPPAAPPSLELSSWCKDRADRLLFFVAPTMRIRFNFARNGLLPWSSFWRAVVKLDRTMRWVVPTFILLSLAWGVGPMDWADVDSHFKPNLLREPELVSNRQRPAQILWLAFSQTRQYGIRCKALPELPCGGIQCGSDQVSPSLIGSESGFPCEHG